jgi:hypothetical protein
LSGIQAAVGMQGSEVLIERELRSHGLNKLLGFVDWEPDKESPFARILLEETLKS